MGVLHAAVKRGSLADVNKLLEKFDETGSPDVNGFDNLGRTALQYAAELGYVDIAAALIEAGAEPVRRARAERDGPAALHYASQNGHVEMVKLLIDSLTGFDRSDHAGAYSEDYTLDSTAMMLCPQAAYLETDMTPLLLACRAGHGQVAMKLISAGSDIEARSGNLFTTLHYACRHPGAGMLPVIEVCIQRGLRDVKSQHGTTPLGIAADRGCTEAIKALLAVGATPSDLNLVALAAEHAHVGAVKAFLEHSRANQMEITLVTKALDVTEEEIRRCLRLEATWDGEDAPSQRLRRYGRIMALLVAAGDRRWSKVPSPCRGLQAALPAVTEAAPEELPQLFERLEEPTQAHIRFILKVLHRLFPAPGDYFQRRAVLAYVLADEVE